MSTLNLAAAAFSELSSYDVNREQSALDLSDPLANAGKLFDTAELSDNVTVITKSVVLDGNINSAAAISVRGKVNGSITTSSDLGVNGIVQGDIEARNVNFNRAGVKGNTKASGDVFVDNETVVVGNISANNIIVNSKVKGDITAQNKVELLNDALTVGTIVAGRINMEDGASANGTLTLVSNKTGADLDKAFNLEV